MECDSSNRIFHMVSSSRQHEYYWRPSRGEFEDAWELLEKTSRLLKDQLEYLPASGCIKYSWGLLACNTRGRLRTTRRGHQDYSNLSYSTIKYSGACRMDLPGPTTSVGTRTDYSVGSWDYSAWATQHLMAWDIRISVEKYLDRKLCMSCTM
jgi:hypothetical protein